MFLLLYLWYIYFILVISDISLYIDLIISPLSFHFENNLDQSTCCPYLHQVYSLLFPSLGIFTTSTFTRSDQTLNFQMVTLSKIFLGGLFPRINMHNMPCIKFYKSDYEIVTWGTSIFLLYSLKFSQFEESYKIRYSENSKLTCLKLILGAFRNHNFHKAYIWNYSDPTPKICTSSTPISLLCLCKVLSFETFHKISYNEFAKITCLKLISREFKNPTFHREYIQNCSKSTSWICTTCTPRSLLYLCNFSRSETSHKISYSECSNMTCLKLISRAFRKPNFHREYLQHYSEPTSEICIACTSRSLLCLWKFSRFETSQKVSYRKCAKMTYLKLMSGALKNPNFHMAYL